MQREDFPSFHRQRRLFAHATMRHLLIAAEKWKSCANRHSLRGAVLAAALVPLLVAAAAAQTASDYPGVGPSEPSATKKLTNSVKSGFSKVSKALIPKSPTKEAPDPISLSVPAEPSAEFHVAVARMAEQADDLAKAEFHYREALELEPENSNALMSYAHMLDRQHKLDQAAQLYQMVVRNYPGNATAHNDLGICYARQGRLDEAAQSIERAVQIRPNQTRYRNNLATILVQSQKLDEAFAHLSEVHPKAVAFYNLGYLLYKAGDPKGAARLFQEALAHDATLTEARVWFEKLRPSGAVAGPTQPRSAITERLPQAIARRPAVPRQVPIVPPAGSAAPMPPADAMGSTPPHGDTLQVVPTMPVTTKPGHGMASRNAPLPSLKPLPPIERSY